jgi:hypothetical protein
LIAFAVNIGNIGRASFRPALMDDWLQELNGRLRGDPVRFVDYFGHTGNFVVDCREGSGYAARRLSQLLDAPCVAISTGTLKKCIDTVERLPCPPAESGVRWTPGALFLVAGSVNGKSLESVPRAVFRRIDDTAVAAWKRDVVTAAGRLDRGRRLGGWGALSQAVGRQLGGVWTARSLSTLRGALNRAYDPVGLKVRAEQAAAPDPDLGAVRTDGTSENPSVPGR